MQLPSSRRVSGATRAAVGRGLQGLAGNQLPGQPRGWGGHTSFHPSHTRGPVPVPGQRGWGDGGLLAGSGFLRGSRRQKGHDILLRAAFKAHDL